MLIEGMRLAGLAVGASDGYVYLWSEYPVAHPIFKTVLERAYSAGYLGANFRGRGNRFDLEVRLAAGAYICGEETTSLDSLADKRSIVRAKPPSQAMKSLFGKPTVVKNISPLPRFPPFWTRAARRTRTAA